MYRTVELSRNNHDFDAARAVAKGVQCVMLRAGCGTGRDGRFDRFSKACDAVGLRTGAYLFMTCHYRQVNAQDPAVAEKLLREEIAAFIQILDGSNVSSWAALDQELEQGNTMGLAPAQNTRLLNLGADMLREAGYFPCLRCTAAWLKNRVISAALRMPVMVIHYYRAPDDPDFSGCSPVQAVNTDWGRYLLSLGNQMIGWKFGRIGHGAEYGAASEDIGRGWLYCQPEEYLTKKRRMEFEPASGVLVLFGADAPACMAFRAPDVTAPAEKLEPDSVCPILERGEPQWAEGLQGVWYRIKTDSPACYVLALPDRCRIIRRTRPPIRVEGEGRAADLLRELADLFNRQEGYM